jgi:hypothetical protein
MARVENDLLTSVVQARLVSSYFTRLAEHPVLQPAQQYITSRNTTKKSKLAFGES